MKSVGGTATQPDFYKGSADVDKILVLYNFFEFSVHNQTPILFASNGLYQETQIFNRIRIP